MLKKTYDKVCELFEEGNGYLPTRTLLNNKIKRLHHILGARNTNDKSKITILIT